MKDSAYSKPGPYTRAELRDSLQYYVELDAGDLFKYDIMLIEYDIEHPGSTRYYDYMMREQSFIGGEDE